MIRMESGRLARHANAIGIDGIRAISARISRTSVSALLISMLIAVLMPDTNASAQTVAWTARSPGGSGEPSGQPGCDFRIVAKGSMAIDADGNSYVTGCSPNGSNDDYLTVKFDATGAVVWQGRYDGTGNSDDQATALSVDASGNVYVTGRSTDGSSSQYDYATIKYDSAGVQQWVAIYNGTHDSYDAAYALSVDASGNVYVTGTSIETSGSYNYATIKYDSAGMQQWVATYNGTGNGFDYAYALAVDANGNVYVTGQSRNAGGDDDYATIKYNSAGVQQWVAIHGGSANGDDQATALSVDASGNVYVTGTSSNGSGSGSNNYVTIKYSSAGALQWASIFNGTGSSIDEAAALAVDASGNVYVTGQSRNATGNDDYATIKFNSAGVRQWTAIYNGTGNNTDQAYALAVDVSGNVYVTGQSYDVNGSDNYATIKYNSAGMQQWAAIYSGNGNHVDQAKALAVDASGNVYVTGSSVIGATHSRHYATIKYDSAGVQQWIAKPGVETGLPERLACNNSISAKGALAVDSIGNSYMTGCSFNGTNQDYQTTKFDAAGAMVWQARYNGTENHDDSAYALAVDASGNVYVTGRSYGASSYDYATIKYNSAGVQQWAAIYNGTGNHTDHAYALSVDASGNVYVTGTAGNNYATIKYDSAGAQQWVAIYNGTGNDYDSATALSLDSSGNVYVTGRSIGAGLGAGFVYAYDYATIKYDSAGAQQWVAVYNGTDDSDDQATALSVDANGNVYVTGHSYSESDYPNFATIKYDSAGVQQWAAIYNGIADRDDQAKALSVDASGNVYVTGHSYSANNSGDFATIKYSSAGVQQWAAIYNGAGNDYDSAYALSLDAGGNAYVTGQSFSANGDLDYATIKYDSAGVQQWAAIYNGAGNDYDSASALSVDASGNAYVTGQSYSANGDLDYATIKYDSAGVQHWVHRFDGTRSAHDAGFAIALAPDGGVLVAGTENSGIGFSSMTVQKILDTPATTIFFDGFE